MGVTLNVMVLFSLVLALGMLVDNGIVTVENIYRHMAEGKNARRAAIEGVGEIAMPIIASTATTLAAFIPLAIWPGIMGEFMKYLPITLMIVLGSSLFVALVINPVLAATYMKVVSDKPNKKRVLKTSFILSTVGLALVIFGLIGIGNLLIILGLFGILNIYVLYPGAQNFQNSFLPKLEIFYAKFLTFALNGRRPLKFFLGTFGLLLFSFVLMGLFPPKVDFFPVNEPNYVNIFISHPIGTDIEVTNETTLKVEGKLNQILGEYSEIDVNSDDISSQKLIKSVISQVGEGCLLYTSPSPRDATLSRMPSSA